MKLINNNNFKLSSLKYIRHYFMSGEIYNGCPIETSVEIVCNYNGKTHTKEWHKHIEHVYILEKDFEKKRNCYDYILEDAENIVNLMEKINLEDLKNNYWSNDLFQSHMHWELEYNHTFKIVGTFDNEIDEVKEIKKILDFDKIEKQELAKVEEEVKNIKHTISIKDAIYNFIHKMQTASDIEKGLSSGEIVFDIQNEDDFLQVTKELNKLYNISFDGIELNNNKKMKQFLIDWLKKIEEVNKIVEEEIKKFNTAIKNNLPTDDQAAVLNRLREIRGISKENNPDIKIIKMKAKKMYSEIDPKLSSVVNEYLIEWRLQKELITNMTLRFLSKVQDLKGTDISDEVLRCEEKINRDNISTILNYKNRYVSELIPILNTVAGRHGNPYQNTVNEVIPDIAEQIWLITHENGVINYLYSNLYDKLPNDEILNIINEIKLERTNDMKDNLKINDNIQFDSKETKAEFQKYLDKINEYNEKIQNGEETDINFGELLNEYRRTFYDDELENKIKEIDEPKEELKFDNKEMDELVDKINKKIAKIDNKNIENVINNIVGADDFDKNNLLCELTKKVIELPENTETTIAELMQLSNSDAAFVDPLEQGHIFNLFKEICKQLDIKIEVNHDEFGGLGYHYKFKKVK